MLNHDQLRNARKHLGLRKKDICDMIGMSQNTINSLEFGERTNIRRSTRIMYACFLLECARRRSEETYFIVRNILENDDFSSLFDSPDRRNPNIRNRFIHIKELNMSFQTLIDCAVYLRGHGYTSKAPATIQTTLSQIVNHHRDNRYLGLTFLDHEPIVRDDDED